ncbi:hypothetical protein H6F93_24560 [Leptolyngbya sp. FACHB-671]|nr:hypothetical protein [Leptolyngbya sp. FACHB-671]MBD2070646.1 hypothetical protein [Leptolyngbya sp. FACHB-671]
MPNGQTFISCPGTDQLTIREDGSRRAGRMQCRVIPSPAPPDEFSLEYGR